jgi:hypothetical protein
MPTTAAVNDNAPVLDVERDALDVASEAAAACGDPRLEKLVGAAVLVATAFRLRDEDALILTLRRLTEAVDALEEEVAEPEQRATACG